MKEIYTINDVEILISTMNRDSLDFLVEMFPFSHFSNFSILIINQTQRGRILTSIYPNVRVINSFERGLSKSRNLALKNSIGEIIVIADDDVIYQEGFIEKIIFSHNNFKDTSAIIFSAIRADGSFMKKYPSVCKIKMNSFDILNTSSIEMTLKKDKLEALGVLFDENFGLGSSFKMGEEAVFLFDIKNKKERLVFTPQIIVGHNCDTTSKKISVLERYYIQGALFTRIFDKKYKTWIFIKLFFDLKQKKVKLRLLNEIFKSVEKGHLNYKLIK